MLKHKANKDTCILIMPSYNEGIRIKKTLNGWSQIIKKLPGSEILIIDGNSTDNTPEVVKEFAKTHKFVKLFQKPREGYGKDLLAGYQATLKTKHKWIFQTDSDMAFRPSDFFDLWEKRNTSPLILGKRHARKDPLYRIALAVAIQIIIILIFKKLIQDANVPFRLIRRDFLERTLSKVPNSTIAPNIFLSILAALEGHKLHSLPVAHYYKKNTKNTSRIVKGAVRGIFEMISFAFRQKQSKFKAGALR